MKIDNFYFVVDNIEESIAFYTELLGEKPTNITDDRWADWKNETRLSLSTILMPALRNASSRILLARISQW